MEASASDQTQILERKVSKLQQKIDKLEDDKLSTKKREDKKVIKKLVKKLEHKKNSVVKNILDTPPVHIEEVTISPLHLQVSKKAGSRQSSLRTCPDTGAS